MNIKKIKSKSVKDYVINDDIIINVVTITDSKGSTKKFYNIKTGKTLSCRDYKKNKDFYINSDFNLTQNDPGTENILANIEASMEMLREIKEALNFVKNQNDIAFEREEKLKRLTK